MTSFQVKFFLVHRDAFLSIENVSYRNLYICLLSFRNVENSECFPSYTMLEKVSLLSRSTISAGLKFLIENNYIGKKQKITENSKINIYTILDPFSSSPSPASDLGPKPVSPDDRAMKLPKTGNEAGAKHPASAPSRPRDQHSHQVPETPLPSG